MASPCWSGDVQVEDFDVNENAPHPHASDNAAPGRDFAPTAAEGLSSAAENRRPPNTQHEESPVSAWKLVLAGQSKSKHEIREKVAEGVVYELKNSDFLQRMADFLYSLQDGALSQTQAEVDQLRVENGRLRAQIVKSSMELPLGVGQPPLDGFKNSEAKSAQSDSVAPTVEEPEITSNCVDEQGNEARPFKAGATVKFGEDVCPLNVDEKGDDEAWQATQADFYESQDIRKSRRQTQIKKLVRQQSMARSNTIREMERNGIDRTKSDAVSTKNARPETAHIFADADHLKQEVRKAIIRPQYSVHQYYWETGVFQCLAKSPYFEYGTLLVITLNSVWLWIDIDFNRANTINDADFMFQFMEYFFVAFFSLEWLVRFLAFRFKRDGLKDAWFVFDSCLVCAMLFDSCAMAFVGAIFRPGNAKASDTNVLKLLRMCRITRMARMARLLKALPELTILIKGIWVAARSVFFTLCLLGLLIYVFAVAFRQLTDGTAIGELYFRSVPYSMKALLLYATLPDMAAMVDSVSEEHVVLGAILMLFILLGSLTVMNMLVGVLVEVVSVVSAVEKEEMLCSFVKRQLQDMLTNTGLDADEDMMISRSEFEMLLVKPAAAKVIQDVGVDPVGLVDFSDYIFADAANEMLTFKEFIDLVLQLRGTNNPTVKDVVDLRKILVQEMAVIREHLQMLTNAIYQLPGAEVMKMRHRQGFGSFTPKQQGSKPPGAALQHFETQEKIDEDVAALVGLNRVQWASPPGVAPAATKTANFHQVLPGEAGESLNSPSRPNQQFPPLPGEDQCPVLQMSSA